MTTGLSDAIRELARTRYVQPAKFAGAQELAIRVKDVWNDLKAQGLKVSGHTPQICSALRTGKFLRENGLEISKIEGPPSGQSPTVVIHYRVAGPNSEVVHNTELQAGGAAQQAETPEEWAHRMTGKIFGLLKEEITAMGGAEAYMRWVRSEDEDEAAEDAA